MDEQKDIMDCNCISIDSCSIDTSDFTSVVITDLTDIKLPIIKRQRFNNGIIRKEDVIQCIPPEITHIEIIEDIIRNITTPIFTDKGEIYDGKRTTNN